ncbi:MAG: hypothetical protein HN674_07380 [Candidatus Marinimicrobia bacterium]|jgi:uncharacterized tellurite resistance protein B-like protein|nr:hypothetical protein [Candidatus Neomarinimicrobiota bacterium]MBT3999390.1 hypothetical protein [Candidatus Neomarinimicrobiota bacterium]MBT4956793.1 hypothetical protein [Candidatus Neomarinimicrobiota bacterium]MBT7822942.1 hypothetical protein [Candidatus Neomarinimicrobiota bacterium]
MAWFSRKDKNQKKKNSPADMSPIEAVTHLCAAIQLADGQVDFEERQSWISTISKLFPEFSEERADRFLNEANQIFGQKSNSEKINYITNVLNRLKTLLSSEQIQLLGPKISELIEADGIVMTAEMEIAKLVEKQLGITILVDEDL